jgi:uncharacterized protein (DUF488 family)
MPAPRLYTIGYQGAGLDQLIHCLQANGVRTLADIRFHPFSRRPEFRQDALRRAVEEAGLAYRHVKALGNPPPSRDAAMAGDEAAYRRLFQAHLDTEAARASLRAVLDWTQAGPVCLMCLERDPEDCHRLMVADRLVADSGLALEHLKPEAKEAAQLRLL